MTPEEQFLLKTLADRMAKLEKILADNGLTEAQENIDAKNMQQEYERRMRIINGNKQVA